MFTGGTPASERLYFIAQKWARILSFIPYVRAIILTGSVYKKTAEFESDIDLIVVSKDERAWLVHAQLFIFLSLLGIRRTKNRRAQKICINSTISETNFHNAKLSDGEVLWYGKSKSHILEKMCDIPHLSHACEEIARRTVGAHVEKKFLLYKKSNTALLNNTKTYVQYYPPRIQPVDSLGAKKAQS